ncbi:hypothetical protein HCG49_16695 [Arenibacter sp. 6A1]|uniref:hypothetical protein n=1 Tax=Arenibacter sp. 6A1 TaxID=2720391 RepID=UPI0014460823|nr:hypothetical protein [Arenibacter sp. 6A1]NKI28194.1 hypothetical protein [Arenibacter sp. 6A1]
MQLTPIADQVDFTPGEVLEFLEDAIPLPMDKNDTLALIKISGLSFFDLYRLALAVNEQLSFLKANIPKDTLTIDVALIFMGTVLMLDEAAWEFNENDRAIAKALKTKLGMAEAIDIHNNDLEKE